VQHHDGVGPDQAGLALPPVDAEQQDVERACREPGRIRIGRCRAQQIGVVQRVLVLLVEDPQAVQGRDAHTDQHHARGRRQPGPERATVPGGAQPAHRLPGAGRGAAGLAASGARGQDGRLAGAGRLVPAQPRADQRGHRRLDHHQVDELSVHHLLQHECPQWTIRFLVEPERVPGHGELGRVEAEPQQDRPAQLLEQQAVEQIEVDQRRQQRLQDLEEEDVRQAAPAQLATRPPLPE
jgi:hypothetical protein